MAKHRREEGEPMSPFLMHSNEERENSDNVCHELIENSYAVWQEPIE